MELMEKSMDKFTDKPLMLTIKETYKIWAGCMKEIAAQVGVPDSYRMVLTFLLRHPGANQKDIAAHRNITTASVSQIIKNMQYEGYLKKDIDLEDQRRVRLYLTEKGESCARQIRQRMQWADEKITMLFTPEKEKLMKQLLAELSEILEKEIAR